MKILSAQDAADYCIVNRVEENHWDCGYIVEVALEMDHNIKLQDSDSWKDLENILHYD